MEPTLTAYLSGIIDGEGHVTIVKDSWDRLIYNPKYMVLLKVGMCNEELPHLLASTFGGTCRPKQRKSLANPNWSDAWVWEVRGPRAAEALTLMLPYLRVKKEHAKVCLLLHERIVQAKTQRRAFHRHSVEEIQERDVLYQRIKQLNVLGQLRITNRT